MLDKIYHALLWFVGMNEHITDQIRRQKKRLGFWWYVLSIGTITLVNILIIQMEPSTVRAVTIILVNAGLWWLFWHIHEKP